ncbi:hypothetical protein M3936_00285 [Sutcliffiella horikoshii]|uniref:hypothetical protein n=1 Tax=Sutcliffiella horikoshii TaxID=79883 RepID=UPI0007D09E7A|nr:hypothetical protein [Sutcliffiella horikoshii]MCM3616005.1 hypothetical protein [Sutcliffiella horikoshii]
MTCLLFQAKAGDGIKKRGLKRSDTFLETAEDAVSEAFGLKERIDKTYKNNISWDYEESMKGSTTKIKILKGYLNGDKSSNPFYLEISTLEIADKTAVAPIKPKKISKQDKAIQKNVISFYK